MLKVLNPATEQIVTEIEMDSSESISRKIERCQSAQQSWKKTHINERISILLAFAKNLQEQAEECAKKTVSETGRPFTQVMSEIRATDQRIKYFCGKISDTIKVEDCYKDDNISEYISWEPLGIVANISAWNYPYFVGCNVLVPSILAGNSIIYKPSEHASLTGLAIYELFIQSGLPKGVIEVIIGDGNTGKALLEHDLHGVFFTGSQKTGQIINQTVATKLTKVGLELGGKDPCYVSNDVDANVTAAAVADGVFYNCGQSCCAVERIYVHEDVYDEFLQEFLLNVTKLKMGDPNNNETTLGPLTRKDQIKVLEAQIKDALDQGAKIETGGAPVLGTGYYFEPTVLTSVNHDMKIMQEESFGPIIGIQKVKNDQEAVELCNDSTYGLTSSVYCRDNKRLLNILQQLDSGTVYGNCCDRVSPYVPWSGRKMSGLGSTLGEIGIETFLQPKSWQIRS